MLLQVGADQPGASAEAHQRAGAHRRGADAQRAAVWAGGVTGGLLSHLARSAFISGMDPGLITGAAVAATAGLLALAALPSRPCSPPADAHPARSAEAL